MYVDDQQHGRIYGSYGMPSLFAIDNAILQQHEMGVVQNRGRCLESDAGVFRLVDPVLFVVPFESHRYTHCITI